MRDSGNQFALRNLQGLIRRSLRIIRKLRCFLRCFREQLDSGFNRGLRREVGVSDAVVPAETVFVDQRPGKAHS